MADGSVQPTGYIGTSARSIDGEGFVAGRASYTADFNFPGQLHAAIVRSPHAAARIKSVRLDDATKVAGVVLALDGAGAAKHLDPIPHYIDAAVFGGRTTHVRCLAVEEARHFGQPVAVVVAADKRTARYAAARVTVEYEPIAALMSADEAVAPGARRLIAAWDANLIMQVPFMNGDAAGAIGSAAHVVRTRVNIHRFSTQPIETRAYNAVWDAHNHSVTLYATAQNPHPLRNVLAQTLRMRENAVRVVAPNIGGAFGMKMHGHPEEALTCLLAKLTGRPVKWVEDREECLLVGGREQLHELEMAVRDDGRIVALRDKFLANTGAPTACPGWGMAFLTGLTMPGPYDIDDIDVQMNAVVTNKPAWNASRGYGKEATAMALEVSLDRVARHLKMDPVQLRLKNFIKSTDFPHKSPTGLIYDSGDYATCLKKTVELLKYDEWRAQQREGRKAGRYLGIGVAYELTPEGGALPGTMVAGYDTSTVKVDPGGSVKVFTGVTSPGGGNTTGIAQIVADEMGVDINTIRLVQGDTDACPYGFGNYSGRSTIVGGGSAALAAADVKAKIAKVAAGLLEVPVESIAIRRGVVSSSAKPDKTLSFGEVCYAAYTRAYDVAACIELPLEATRTFKPGLISHMPDEKGRINPYPSYSNAAYATVCELDIETGQVKLLAFAVVHDCGKVINPMLVEGQACGAIAMGVGGMLGEDILFDARGRQTTTGFKDYVMPRALDIPKIAMGHHDSPNPVTFMGLKGAGEAGVGGSAAAVANAINDALAHFGVEITDFPLTPPRIWAALQANKSRGVAR
jgi:carbon-monoxide dehydrogenase large subunit